MKSEIPAQIRRRWIVFMFVLGLLPVSMAARAQGDTASYDYYYQLSPDGNVMIEPFYEILGFVGPISDYTGLIVDYDRLPVAPPVPELRRNIELPMMMPGDRRGIEYRTYRGEAPGTILQDAPREWTRVELESRYRERLDREREFQPIYGLVAPIRPGNVTRAPAAPSDRGR